MYYDWTYVLILIGLALSLWASAGMKNAYSKYSQVASSRGITAAEAAERILYGAGITDVRIERVEGDLTDHYDSAAKTLRLSDTVYQSTSIAAIGA